MLRSCKIQFHLVCKFIIAVFVFLFTTKCETINTKTTNASKTDSTANSSPVLQRLNALNELIQKNPQQHALYAERANLHYLLNDSANCFKDISKAIQLRSTEAEYQYLKGFFAYHYDLPDTAIVYFQYAHELNKSNPDYLFYLANAFTQKKQFLKAIQYYDKAISQDNQNNEYLYAKAFALYQIPKVNEATTLLNQILKNDSLHLKSQALLAEIYLYAKKDFPKAYEKIQFILKNDTTETPHFLEGDFYFHKAELLKDSVEKEGMYRLAIDCYSKAIKKNPYHVNAFYNRGYTFFVLKRYDLAEESFQEVLRQNPKDYRAAFLLGSIAEFYDDKALATQYYKQALSINPNFIEAKQALEEIKQ